MAKHAVASRPVTDDVAPLFQGAHSEANSVAGQANDDTRKQAAHLNLGDGQPDGESVPHQPRTRPTPIRLGVIWGVTSLVALTALAGWLGHRAYESHRALQERALFLQVGRQGAVNLTTIDWEHADADTQRILNGSTGPFYDEFSARSKAFVDVVKQAKSKSVGTVAEAGLESESADQAQILVAVAVAQSSADAPQQESRDWRMRVTVQKVGNDVKVANVGFVP
jgi:Mce-associated membrane protein